MRQYLDNPIFNPKNKDKDCNRNTGRIDTFHVKRKETEVLTTSTF